eukprot:CAMPEP_0182926248 /NCGR_PEP_ID=MMETSP0105_2-20130417/11319_1 /TAXON_ID=81532 ORGANISM="Acanthoeca-like sp., Strain 10tr" /NCGR_SAMPLE_ID=MMETSP0105_2 /ASSEMBLY_ACC=CAM_ASM_000205 /LENGTH=530 /DNA_ID=CAMNT_0025064129 /DNA_START=18 /DNA_END=1610 /DNA_ORIENTATION=+
MPRHSNAEIDKTLFGNAKKNKARASARSDGSAGLSKASAVSDFYSGGGSAGAKPRTRRTMQLVTKNEVRNLTIRRTDTGPSSVVISMDDYRRIRTNAVPLDQQHSALAATARRDRAERLAEESERRKAEYAAIDAERNDDGMNELDIIAAEREAVVLAKAKEQLEDDEDEVRILKSTILQAQCQAVRDAQLREKDEIAQALKEEEQRLDEMMEQARVRKIQEAEDKERGLKIAYIEGRKELEKQIEEREMQRLLEEELREHESQQVLKRIEEMALEDKLKAEERAVHTKKMQAEIVAANDYALQMAAERAAAAKAEDEELAQYVADKVAAEEAAEQRKIAEKAAADAAFRKVLQRQEAALDTMADREEKAARRAHEEKERQLRAKEAADAIKRRTEAAELNAARRAQIETMQRQKAIMSMAEKADFETNIAKAEAVIAKERAKEEALHTRRIANRNDVLDQIKQKEAATARDRAEFFAEGVKIDEEAKTRRARLDEIKQRKLDDLVATGLDPNYMHSVNRQITKSSVKAL